MKSKRKDRCSGIENLEQRRLLAIDTAVVPGLTFESAQVFSPPGIDRDGLAATEYIDLDGDGHRDLIYARQSANGFSVSQSLGDGNFESPLTSTAIREQILHLHAADINGDNVMDLLAASQNKGTARCYAVSGL